MPHTLTVTSEGDALALACQTCDFLAFTLIRDGVVRRTIQRAGQPGVDHDEMALPVTLATFGPRAAKVLDQARQAVDGTAFAASGEAWLTLIEHTEPGPPAPGPLPSRGGPTLLRDLLGAALDRARRATSDLDRDQR